MTNNASHVPLRVIPLGGLGEIGKNMMVLEWGDDIVVVDCGVMFPGEDAPGVDLGIPDVSYLIERAHKVRAILITHGHEDHTGALPYVLPRLNAPVYAPRLAHGLISVKLRDHGIHQMADLRVLEPGEPVSLGRFEAEAFRVCHSIPDAMGLAINTPAGRVIHTGDFKVDHTPVDGGMMDFARLARFGEEGTLLLLSDSTYAEMEGYTPSEQVVGDALDRAIAEAPGRALVATFASLIARIQQVIDAAARHNRKVAIVGRRMVDNVAMARDMGYLTAPPGLLIPLRKALRLPQNQVVLITTGSQGEPTSALVRIANGSHRQIDAQPGDTVIISASAIPGNEKVVNRTINNLTRQGARVLYDKIATVHVHGHGAREDLKLMLRLTKPRFFVPVHGEYRGLAAHAALAREVGVKKERVFVLEDGDALELNSESGSVVDRLPARSVYVEGGHTLDSDSGVLRDRKAMSQDGVVVVVVGLDRLNGAPLMDTKVVSCGFMEDGRDGELFEKVAGRVYDALDSDAGASPDWGRVSEKVKKLAGELLYKDTGRRPMIVPLTLKV